MEQAGRLQQIQAPRTNRRRPRVPVRRKKCWAWRMSRGSGISSSRHRTGKITCRLCCAALLFGDHLAFTVNFQPTLVSSIMVGKLTGGLGGFALAYWLSVPKALELERLDNVQPVE